jgi:tRNA pseudouridine55 synthase
VQFLIDKEKEYEAIIRFGLETDTYDVTGRKVSTSSLIPSRKEIFEAFRNFQGSYLQTPPPISAKKISGRPSYSLVRAGKKVTLTPVNVTVRNLDLSVIDNTRVKLRLTCSAGFYVRSLAHDVGRQVGSGACLESLRRIRSGQFDLLSALTLEEFFQDPEAARQQLIPLQHLLPNIPEAIVNSEGQRRVSHGQEIGPAHITSNYPNNAIWVRLLSQNGSLLALAKPAQTPGSLHPSVVLM